MQKMIADLDSTRKAQADKLAQQAQIDQEEADREVAEAIMEELEERITDIAAEIDSRPIPHLMPTLPED